jgi:hypothetical protein
LKKIGQIMDRLPFRCIGRALDKKNMLFSSGITAIGHVFEAYRSDG